ncbi:hypothetical protein C0Z18_28915 [Trinickia dabaoshanensis]|uniref:Uncharacterized protein n=1 Tax=Trinickia dabaoshanensis TaxID=564714 RepID=A0A2N7VD11_9BURK|nr:hypothetical protein C0Z18_28915 [Trinickia dabaoshanensis]
MPTGRIFRAGALVRKVFAHFGGRRECSPSMAAALTNLRGSGDAIDGISGSQALSPGRPAVNCRGLKHRIVAF